jgi:succinate dehydrogenase / fumarate reductase iron-sulfur subunit
MNCPELKKRFNCTEACPRGIQVTKAIQEVKRSILFDRF